MSDARLERVKLMPEYLCGMPLWLELDGVGQVGAGHSGASSLLALPPSLVERLASWQEQFDRSFHHVRGWTDEDVRASWTHESELLVLELRSHLPRGVALDVDLWPLDDAGRDE
jgi:hypothetical protein